MSETPKDPDSAPHDPVAEKAEELHLENLAIASRVDDPEFMQALTDRRAAEAEAEATARRVAAKNAQRHQARAEQARLDNYPWGFDGLDRDDSPQAILDRVRAQGHQGSGANVVGASEPTQSNPEREQAISEAMTRARERTVELADMVAQRLGASHIPADTRVQVQYAKEAKKFSGREFRLKGHLRATKHDISLEDEAEGWVLPISGQLDGATTVVLCKDGRILTALGRQVPSDQQGQPGTLYVPANRVGEMEEVGIFPLINRPKASVKPTHTYSSYLDEHFESDLGMVNLPVGNPIAGAHNVFAREQAMQEAVMSLLVKHDVSLEEAPTLVLSAGPDTETKSEAPTEQLVAHGHEPDPADEEETEVIETESAEGKGGRAIDNDPGRTTRSREAAATLLRRLVDSGGFQWWRPAQEQTGTQETDLGAEFSPSVTKVVDARIAKLRAQGKSGKSLFRQLAKEFHPDANDRNSYEGIQYINALSDREARGLKRTD